MPPGIANQELFKLLGDILGHSRHQSAISAMRPQLMQHGFSWQSLTDLANEQDVLPPMILALAECGLLLPTPRAATNRNGSHATVRLNECYHQHLARRRSEKTQLENILLILGRAGIAPLILKGARYLVAPLGSWCEARTIRDIDILVRPNEAEAAFGTLIAEGYRPGHSYMPNYHHLPELQRAGEPAAVEIHTDALATPGQRVMSTEFAWMQAITIGYGGFLVLPNKWQALHCLLHHQLSDRGYARKILAVKPLWEWTMLARDFSRDDWKEVVAHMQAADALDMLGSWLVQSHRLFGLETPAFIPVSANAYANACGAFEQASKAHWRRRVKFVADQLRFSFARDTLAKRYGKPLSSISLMDAGKYAAHLVRLHRGNLLRRMLGHRDRLS